MRHVIDNGVAVSASPPCSVSITLSCPILWYRHPPCLRGQQLWALYAHAPRACVLLPIWQLV